MSVQWWKPFHLSPRLDQLILPQVASLPPFPVSLRLLSIPIGSEENSSSQMFPSTSTPFPNASMRFCITSCSPQAPTAVLEPWYIPHLSLTLATGSLLCHLQHLGCIYLTENFARVFIIGSEFVSTERRVLPHLS